MCIASNIHARALLARTHSDNLQLRIRHFERFYNGCARVYPNRFRTQQLDGWVGCGWRMWPRIYTTNAIRTRWKQSNRKFIWIVCMVMAQPQAINFILIYQAVNVIPIARGIDFRINLSLWIAFNRRSHPFSLTASKWRSTEIQTNKLLSIRK